MARNRDHTSSEHLLASGVPRGSARITPQSLLYQLSPSVRTSLDGLSYAHRGLEEGCRNSLDITSSSKRIGNHSQDDRISNQEMNWIELDAINDTNAKDGPKNLHMETVSPKPDAPSIRNENRMVNWRPFFLNRIVLLSLLAFFVASIIALEIINKTASDQQGFGPINSRFHYLWTFGPTTLLTIVLALCTQIELAARQIFPWILMLRQRQKASQSILLDYMGSSIFFILYNTLRKRHWFVFIPVVITGFVRILIAVSTALLVLRNDLVDYRNYPLKLIDEFSTEAIRNESIFIDVDATPAVIYAATLNKSMNLPIGTTDRYVVPLFETVPHHDGTIRTADVHSFTTDLTCEIGSITYQNIFWESGRSGGKSDLAVESESCQSAVFGPHPSWNSEALPTFNAVWSSLARCNNTNSDDYRLVIASGYLNSTNGTDSDFARSGELKEGKAVICNPSYRLLKSSVSLSDEGTMRSFREIENTTVFKDAEHESLTKAIISSIEMFTWMAQMDDSESVEKLLMSAKQSDSFGSERAQIDELAMFAFITAGQDVDIWDPSVQIEWISKGFKAVAAQIAKRYLFKESQGKVITGSWTRRENRVHVTPLALRLMEAILGILSVLMVILIILSPNETIPEDPYTIGRIAAIVSQSNAILEQLDMSGPSPIPILKARLEQFTFWIERTMSGKEAFRIETATEFNISNSHLNRGYLRPRKRLEYWNPFHSTLIMRVLLVILPACLAIVLEVLYRQSVKKTGFMAVPRNNKVAHFAWTFVPGIFMIFFQLLYTVADFNVRIFDSYCSLKRGTCDIQGTLFSNLFLKLSPVAFWITIRHRKYGAALSLLSVFLASVLTIVVSGLFTTDLVPAQKQVQLAPISSFDNTVDYSSVGDLGMPRQSYINSQHMALLLHNEVAESPLWTSGNLVFPSLSIKPETENHSQNYTKISAVVPAHRANMNCTPVPHDNLIIAWEFEEQTNISGYSIKEKSPLVPGCPSRTTGGVFAIDIVDVDGYFALNPSWSGSPETDGITDCPYDVLIVGHIDNQTTPPNVNWFEFNECVTTIQEVSVRAEFSLPGWSILTATPDEATSQSVQRGIGSSINTRIFEGTRTPNDSKVWSEDAHFQEVIRFSGIPDVAQLMDNHGSSFKDAYENMYSSLGAITILMVGRNITVDANDQATIAGTAVDFSQLRLFQNKIPTRIL